MIVDRRLVGKLLTGQHHARHAGRQAAETFGPGGGKHADRSLRRPQGRVRHRPQSRALGVGEAYMDGRLIIEDGTILDLLELVTGANRWEDGEHGPQGDRARASSRFKRWFRRNKARRARSATSPIITTSSDELYELFLDDDLQYSCAYFTDPGNSLEQAQADKKAHIAAKLALEAGPARARHRLRLGRDGALSAQGRGRRRARRHLVGRAAEDRPRARRGGGRLRPCEVRADRLSPARQAGSTGSSRSACSSMSAPRITTNSSPSAASC